jgi:hypothetical protein
MRVRSAYEQGGRHGAGIRGIEPDSPSVLGAILVIESRSVLRVARSRSQAGRGLGWAPGGRALISRSRKHIEFDGNKKAPTEVRALGLVQVAGAYLRH